MTRNHPVMYSMIAIAIVVCSLFTGCETDDTVTQIALESAERQAQQSRDTTELQKQVAAGSKELVASDAASRENFSQLHREVQQERQELAGQWNRLEAERQSVASSRRHESLALSATRGMGIVVVVTLALFFAWLLLFQAHTLDPSTESLEMLITDITSDSPQLLPKPTNTPRITNEQENP